jgi:hypothetical protein
MTRSFSLGNEFLYSVKCEKFFDKIGKFKLLKGKCFLWNKQSRLNKIHRAYIKFDICLTVHH